MDNTMKIGIIGSGNLGCAIASCLSRKSNLTMVLGDVLEEKAKEASAKMNCQSMDVEQMVKELDIIFLALPPQAMESFIVENEVSFRQGSIIVNLSTGKDTMEIQEKMQRNDIDLIGLKPVCQATALESMEKTVFLTSSKSENLELLSDLLSKVGKIYRNEEMQVQKINELATLRALELIIQVRKDLEQFQVEDDVLDCAIKSVALGTLMDFPYTKERKNDYIDRLVEKYGLNLYED